MKQAVSARRRLTQKGVEALEFALFATVMASALVWMFTSGMNFLRFNKANDTTRAAALMYVKGTDMLVLGTQEIIQRLGEGIDLKVDNGAAAGTEVQSYSRGSGLIILSQVQYVGPVTCPSGCTNYGKYVFMHRAYIGNKILAVDDNPVSSALGNPSNAAWNSTTGIITNPHGDSGAQVNSSFAGTWPTGGALGDGQIAYVIEAYFSGTFGTGQFNGNGIYTRIIM